MGSYEPSPLSSPTHSYKQERTLFLAQKGVSLLRLGQILTSSADRVYT